MSRADQLLVLLLLAPACTYVNRIETCDEPIDRDVQVNAGTNGDQITTFGRSLARLPSGNYVAVWMSQEGPDGTPTRVKATIVTPTGQMLNPCGGDSGDVDVSQALDEVASRPTVAVGPSTGGPIYFAWRATPMGVEGSVPGSIRARLLAQDLCEWAGSDVFTGISDTGENTAAPAIAVRDDGNEALISWIDLSVNPRRLRSRPIGVANVRNGQVERSACSATDPICTHSTSVALSPPALTPVDDGYALVWGELKGTLHDGHVVRQQRLDRFGAILSDARGARPFGDVAHVSVGAFTVGREVLVVEAGVAQPDVPTPDDNHVFLERFGVDGGSAGSVQRVDSQAGVAPIGPAIAATRAGALFVAWEAQSGMSSEVRARFLSPSGAPLFSGLACDDTDFRVSSLEGTRRGGVSVAADEDAAQALFFDATPTPRGTDTLGLSVHVRRFDVAKLVPTLR